MIQPAKHKRENERLEALKNTNLLDTEAEQEFDDITLLASFITKSPVSMISLIDAERQWFKSKKGLDFNETSRDTAFCAHAIHETEIFEIQDAEQDERFKDNPLVVDHKLKFYAGTQLTTDDGLPLGMLCVMDKKPRKLTEEERKALNALGRQVLSQIKLREKNNEVCKELDIARNLQRSMLPAAFVPNDVNPKIEIYASMNCAKEVGGDLYDYFFINEKKLAIVLGDVSGKGVSAAIYMAMSKSLIRAMAATSKNPAECIYKVNNSLVRESSSSMFITLFFGVFDIETGELEFVNCGHNPPISIKKNNSINRLNIESQLILGVVENYNFISEKIKLEKEDSILFYTDGITEAFDINENEYSEKRLLKFCEENSSKSLEKFSNDLIFDVYKFSQGVIQSDDLTMLILKYDY